MQMNDVYIYVRIQTKTQYRCKFRVSQVFNFIDVFPTLDAN